MKHLFSLVTIVLFIGVFTCASFSNYKIEEYRYADEDQYLTLIKTLTHKIFELEKAYKDSTLLPCDVFSEPLKNVWKDYIDSVNIEGVPLCTAWVHNMEHKDMCLATIEADLLYYEEKDPGTGDIYKNVYTFTFKECVIHASYYLAKGKGLQRVEYYSGIKDQDSFPRIHMKKYFIN